MAQPGANGLSKNERRDAAREKARQQRERQRRREKQRRLILQGGIGVVIIAIVTIVALVLVNSHRAPSAGPRNMADDGIVIGTGLKAQPTAALAADATPKQRAPKAGVVAIRTYEDFQCPVCESFEKAHRAEIEQLVESGKATLQIYPVAILDASSNGNRYSSRSANAAACVANYSPNQFYALHTILYAHQPAEGGDGMSDDQLKAYIKQAKVTNYAAISKCVSDETYKNFVADATDRFSKPDLALSNVKNRSLTSQTNGIGTPTVIVNGKQWNYNDTTLTSKNDFANFILSAQSATTTPSATPSPSAVPQDTATPSPTSSK